MADLPQEGRVVEEVKQEVPLTTEQRLDNMARDIQELARGLNAQAALLEAVVMASDLVVKKYIAVTKAPTEEKKV